MVIISAHIPWGCVDQLDSQNRQHCVGTASECFYMISGGCGHSVIVAVDVLLLSSP